MNPIEFEAKTDRELLLIVAQTTNQIVVKVEEIKGCVDQHESRITILETTKDKIELKKAITIGVGVSSGLAAVFFGLGKLFKWW